MKERRRPAHAAGLHDNHQDMEVVQLDALPDAIAQRQSRPIAKMICLYPNISLCSYAGIGYLPVDAGWMPGDRTRLTSPEYRE